jgi:DNA (cytosine-5)-methyltransferase 1
MKKIKIIDAFAGVGGFRIAVKNALKSLKTDYEFVASIEKDKHCRQTYNENFKCEILDDITKIDAKDYPAHDLLVGGFPCQSFSVAGNLHRKNKGKVDFKDDPRSELIYYVINILKVKKPKYFVLENVKGLLKAMNPDGSYFIDSILDEIKKLGYDVKYKLLDSSDYGIAQKRERVIFVGALNKSLDKFKFPKPQKKFKVVKDILDKTINKKHLLTEEWKTYTLNMDHGKHKVGTSRLKYMKFIYPKESRKKDTKREKRLILDCEICNDTPNGRSRQRDRLYSPYGLSPTLTCTSMPAFSCEDGWRKLSPREAFRLQGFPESFKIHPNNNQAYKQAGNTVPVNMLEAVVKEFFKFLS